MRSFVAVVFGCLVVVLSGCVSWLNPDHNQGCKVQYQQGGKWTIHGIDIPINHPLIGTIKIANVDYSGPDYSKISETIRILDQARLGYCSLTTSTNFHLLSQDVRDETFRKAAASNDAIVNFAIGLKKAKTPGEGLSAQRTAADVIPAVQPTSPGAFIDTEARLALADLSKAIQGLRTQVSVMTQRLEENRVVGATRIKLTGFEPNGSALLAEHRKVILSEVGSAIAAVPLNKTPTVLLIGYADNTGISVNNADLALRRAANVAEFLRRHDFGRNFHTEVTSGGVSSLSSGELARSVDVVVSLLPVESILV